MTLPFTPLPHIVTRIAVVPQASAIAEAVEEAIALSPDAAAPSGVSAADGMRLALTEALNNVIEHGEHDALHPIHLHIATSGDRYWVVVEDAGVPLPLELLSAPEHREGPDFAAMMPDALPEGGWGWMLIHASVSQVDYARVDGRNFLLLAVPIGALDLVS